jgi:hypothetical protein
MLRSKKLEIRAKKCENLKSPGSQKHLGLFYAILTINPHGVIVSTKF